MPTKTFLARLDPRAIKGVPPWACVLINQGACPGLGTFLAGRRCGLAQMVVMVAGFVLVLAFFGCYLVCCARYLMSTDWDEGVWRGQYAGYFWMLYSGLLLCGLAWFWSLCSSIGILRQPKSGR